MSTSTVMRDAVFGDHGTRSATLDRLPDGERARVVAIGGEAAVRRRLLEMGLCAGTTVTAVRRAPLADPIEFEVRGYHLSLRSAQAALIVVAPE
ncbi:MAG TPA: FeoA family protein [Planctomycetota bacterium]|nr:FeoA family protein [Planctomycetota bacterium]